MTSSTWICSFRGRLVGVGVDCERVSRFQAFPRARRRPLPAVFSDRDVAFARESRDPAGFLCASFCAKEAVAKALGSLYDFTACGFSSCAPPSESSLLLSDSFRFEHGVSSACAHLCWTADAPPGGHAIVVVHLFA